ncbi:hypothetical protein BJ170DRAFT_598414 [Xylariales sp. AK1849]|nr:hypothetical protein BJ170DRAFT_598414 [Xylariales sp. AK1849]
MIGYGFEAHTPPDIKHITPMALLFLVFFHASSLAEAQSRSSLQSQDDRRQIVNCLICVDSVEWGICVPVQDAGSLDSDRAFARHHLQADRGLCLIPLELGRNMSDGEGDGDDLEDPGSPTIIDEPSINHENAYAMSTTGCDAAGLRYLTAISSLL